MNKKKINIIALGVAGLMMVGCSESFFGDNVEDGLELNLVLPE